MGTATQINQPVLFFDGVCNLCNSSVQFIIKRDNRDIFRFASLQSEKAKELLPKSLINQESLQSLVLLKEGRVFTKSTAALTISKDLSGLWPVLYVFILVPKFIRDAVYNMIARNRYKWFGKQDQCMIPSPDLKLKFID